eukprot:SAG11_NODE_30756_length_298_cov_0.567839_1_plen_31_part_01
MVVNMTVSVYLDYLYGRRPSEDEKNTITTFV